LEGKEDEEKKENNERIVKLEFFQNYIFGHVKKKICTFTFWCMMVIPLGQHLV
jgi:hypothetical protein